MRQKPQNFIFREKNDIKISKFWKFFLRNKIFLYFYLFVSQMIIVFDASYNDIWPLKIEIEICICLTLNGHLAASYLVSLWSNEKNGYRNWIQRPYPREFLEKSRKRCGIHAGTVCRGIAHIWPIGLYSLLTGSLRGVPRIFKGVDPEAGTKPTYHKNLFSPRISSTQFWK